MTTFEYEHYILNALAGSMPHRLYAKDADGHFIFANDAVIKGMGASSLEDLLGKTDFDFYPESDAAEYSREEQEILLSGVPMLDRLEHVTYRLKDEERWLLTTKVPFTDSDNKVVGIVGINYDITQQKHAEQGLEIAKKQAEASSKELEKTVSQLSTEMTERRKVEDKLREQALYDNLTGLPNRVLLMDRLDNAIGLSKRQNSTLTVMFIDMDRLKVINDTLGHLFGDKLLKKVSQRIHQCIRSTDTLARLGGDEFILVLPNTMPDSALIRITQEIADAVSMPLSLGGSEISVSCSIGCSFFPRDGDDPTILLKKADAAMYQAKQLGGNQVQYYAKEKNKSVSERLEIEVDLKSAIKNNELVLHYQPQLDVKTNKITGVEALIRWIHPDKGLIPPNVFIPIAEEVGIIGPISEWVLRTACYQAMSWQKAGMPEITMSVNLSAHQFLDADLNDQVVRVLAETQLPAKYLELELTESVSMKDPQETMLVLQRFKSQGISLAIDDFGTGYSNFAYLHRFDVDCIKIDLSFISVMMASDEGKAIVEAMITLVHKLNLVVVAEGVETIEEFQQLAAYDCDTIQGYWFSRPLPAQVCEDFIRDHEQSAQENIDK